VTEIRVHGVGGTTPEALLEQTGVRQVTGDDKAGMYRGAIPHPDRTVEAYSWGGLTARSRSRALWVLLLPFSLINLSGWMVEPPRENGVPVTAERTYGIRWHELVVQLIAVITTAMYVMWAALISMNVLAFQCGAIEECRTDRWYMEPFNAGFFADHPGRRIVIGLTVPVGLLFFFWLLGKISRTRYDEYGQEESATYSADAPAAAGSVIGLARFWHTSEWQRAVARVHITVVLAILAGLLGRAAGEFDAFFRVQNNLDELGPAVFYVAVFTASLAMAGLVRATYASGSLLGSGVPGFARFTRYTMAAALALLATAAVLTWRLDAPDTELVPPVSAAAVAASGTTSDAGSTPTPTTDAPSHEEAPPGDGTGEAPVRRPTTDLWGFGWAPILLLGGAAILIAAFSAVQLWRWFVWRLIHLDQMVIPVMLLFVVLWDHAVWVALVSAVIGIGVQSLPGVVGGMVGEDAAEAEPEDRWRLQVFLAVCVLGGVVSLLTSGADYPWGEAWPRMTPVLAFTLVLAGLNLAQCRAGVGNNRGRAASASTVVTLTLLPVAVIATGVVLHAVMDRDEWFQGAAWLAWTVLAVAWIAQFEFDGWRWNGPAAVAMLGLAITMGAFSGLVIWLVDLLDRDGTVFELRATGIYEWLTIAFAVMLIAIVGGMASWFLLVKQQIGVGPHGEPAREGEALPAVVNAADAVITVAAMLLVAGIAALLLHLWDSYDTRFQRWIDDTAPADWRGIVQVASWIALGVSAGVVLVVRNGLKDHGLRTKFGILWDVASFWPRTFHPFAPPSYAVRAVPELQRRVTEVVTAAASRPDTPGDAAFSGGAAIVSGHSQGSVLSLSAAVTLRHEVRPWVRLVTHGSPLARLYQRFFPRYFPKTLLSCCAESLGPTGTETDGGWLNFWRGTDPIGDAVFGAQDAERPAGYPPAGVVAALDLSLSGATQLPDVHLADPQDPRNRFELESGARGHSGYMADEAMWRAVAAIAADLDDRLASTEYVTMLDDEDRAVGVAERTSAHLGTPIRHLAVSVFLFDADGRLLLQRRSSAKALFAGRWANSCCTHPRPGEAPFQAALRCADTELGLRVGLAEVGPLRYTAPDPATGGTEDELTIVFAGRVVPGTPAPNPAEIAELDWVDVDDLRAAAAADPEAFAPWLIAALTPPA
jgi:isopentenyl-diphosphate delta-isomerase type 1